MLISFECILALTRMGFGMVTLPSKGPMRAPVCLRYGKILVIFIDFLFSINDSRDSASFCLK